MVNRKNSSALLVLYAVALHLSLSNTQQPPADACNAVFLFYNYTGGYPIKPTDPANQPYRFASTLTVLNNGPTDLPTWKVHVGFRNGEILVSSTNAALADGTSVPAFVGNGTSLVGVGRSRLKSAIETAGDSDQTMVVVELVGTRFLRGGSADVPPLPENLFLVWDEYSCPAPTFNGTPTFEAGFVEMALRTVEIFFHARWMRVALVIGGDAGLSTSAGATQFPIFTLSLFSLLGFFSLPCQEMG